MLEVVDITHVRVAECAICPTHAPRPGQMPHCLLHEYRHFLPFFMPRPLMRISTRPVKYSFTILRLHKTDNVYWKRQLFIAHHIKGCEERNLLLYVTTAAAQSARHGSSHNHHGLSRHNSTVATGTPTFLSPASPLQSRKQFSNQSVRLSKKILGLSG